MSKSSPTISVVIPYYNNATTIHRALESVKRQAYPPCEVIIVNDASPDAHLLKGIVAEFPDLPIELIHHKHNRNGSAARNTGIASAKGECVAFLDADDEWTKGHLASYVSRGIQTNTLYFCRAKISAPDFSVLSEYRQLGKRSVSEYIFVNNGFIQTSSFLLHADVVRREGFNEALVRHQDYDFLFKLEAAGVRFVMSNHVGVIVHWENNTLTVKESKGGSAQFSLEWARSNRQHFTDKAYAYFLFMNVLVPLLRKGERKAALGLIRTENLFPAMSLGNIYRTLSLFFFRRIIKPRRGSGS